MSTLEERQLKNQKKIKRREERKSFSSKTTVWKETTAGTPEGEESN